MQEGSDAANQYKAGEEVSLFSQEVLKATAPIVLMDYSEVYFILSEIRDWDNALYKKAVEASFDRWGVSSSRKAGYTIADISSLSEENKKERVLTQKYISLYMNPDEAWAEYRRTGFPELAPSLDNLNPQVITNVQRGMRRLRYPDTERDLNKQNYEAAVRLLNGADNEATDLPWAKRN